MTQTHVFPAPALGWMTSSNITAPPAAAAEQLDNLFPTAQGAKARGGCSKHATLGATAVRFMQHKEGSAGLLFSATAADIFEISSPADPDVAPTADWTGQTSGDWSYVQFATSADNYMVAVNGADHAIWHDGTDMQPLVDETVYDLAYDALTGAFTVGQTVTGGTSGATAEILGIAPTSATAGTLKIGAITGGPFQDNEALTDALTGAATSNIPSGTSTASSITVTNVATNTLTQCWMWMERVFFIEKDSMSMWYLPAESIGGAATEYPLGAVFREGGNLLFGANWSLDSGDGLGDKCVIVTDQGEVAVYGGTDPASASTFTLEGVYKIGKPVDKHAHFNFGGELYVITNEGIVPLSKAVAMDRAALIQGALTAPIEDDWLSVIGARTSSQPVTAAVWRSNGFLMVSTPLTYQSKPVAYVANVRTGAWARYLGWDVRASTVFENRLFFGAADGFVYEGEVGGNDNGTAYTAIWVPKFSEMGTPQIKVANHAGLVARSNSTLKFGAKAFKDYTVGTISAPLPMPEPDGAATWGASNWGSAVWGSGGIVSGATKWKTVANAGFSLSCAYAVTANQTSAPVVEITGGLLRYEIGEVL